MDGLCPDIPNHYIEIILDNDNPKHNWLIEAFEGSFGEESAECVSLDESRTRLKVYPGGALALRNHRPPLSGDQEATT